MYGDGFTKDGGLSVVNLTTWNAWGGNSTDQATRIELGDGTVVNRDDPRLRAAEEDDGSC